MCRDRMRVLMVCSGIVNVLLLWAVTGLVRSVYQTESITIKPPRRFPPAIDGARLATLVTADQSLVSKPEYVFTGDWFTQNVAVWDRALDPFKGRAGLSYLEVGVHEGMSLIWMLENVLTAADSSALAVDPWEGDGGAVVQQRVFSNIKNAGAADRVTLVKGYSQVELRKLPLESFDIIYVDGSHEGPDVLEDGILSWRLLAPGGLLIFDDYLWNRGRRGVLERPELALNTFFYFFADQLEVVHVDYQVILRKKRAPASVS